jgi:hypothetical protein
MFGFVYGTRHVHKIQFLNQRFYFGIVPCWINKTVLPNYKYTGLHPSKFSIPAGFELVDIRNQRQSASEPEFDINRFFNNYDSVCVDRKGITRQDDLMMLGHSKEKAQALTNIFNIHQSLRFECYDSPTVANCRC